jgi:uncharacterized protein YycO
MTETPPLGAFGVVRTNGWQAWVIRLVTQSDVNHAILHVGNGDIVEADPAGAVCVPLHCDHVIWSAPPPDGKAELIAAAALRLVGTPYSWVDDACIGLAKIFGWHVPESVRKRLNRRDRLMCSQLVDRAYHVAGVDLFNDGRLDGDVSPGDLLDLITGHDRTKVVTA